MASDPSQRASVVTRFAPSPTGSLHLGGARTALFNLLYARKHGGKFVLRIDDTDRARSTEEAVAGILDQLAWVGVTWDEGPVFQSHRLDRHAAVARELLAQGRAYQCFATEEDLAAMRRRAAKAGKPPRYDGLWRDRDAASAPEGAVPVIRLKAPQTGATVIDDQVAGSISFSNADLDDFVLLRSDGSPTYMLSTVVDDQDLGVTHVIRGNDHLTNAARQAQLIDALGWTRPVYAHVPLIHGDDGQKLSKRHGAIGVDALRDEGFLSEAVALYLTGLGWSDGGKDPVSLEEAISRFDLSGIGKGAARFDHAKLTSVNFERMKVADDATLAAGCRPFLEKSLERTLTDTEAALLIRAMPGLKQRAKTLIHLAETAAFYFRHRPIEPDAEAKATLTTEALGLLRDLAEVLKGVEPWSREAIDRALKAWIAERGLGFKAMAQPLRAAITGRGNSPGISEVLELLGRDESLGRIGDTLSRP